MNFLEEFKNALENFYNKESNKEDKLVKNIKL